MFTDVVTLVTLVIFWVGFRLIFDHDARISRINENGLGFLTFRYL